MSNLNERWAALMAAGKVRWMPGMLTNRRVRNVGAGAWYAVSAGRVVISDPDEGEAPDFTDPATVGCVVHMLDKVAKECSEDGTEAFWDAHDRAMASIKVSGLTYPHTVEALLNALNEAAP